MIRAGHAAPLHRSGSHVHVGNDEDTELIDIYLHLRALEGDGHMTPGVEKGGAGHGGG